MSGILYVVATPIGNLDDMSPRAVETLKRVRLILAEDTRVTLKLLNRFDIKSRLESYHKFSEKRSLDRYISMLSEGVDIALVSDAGTPAVSDPGKFLVREALEAGLKVVPVPGPSAAMALFSTAGIMDDRFVFAGFLPSKGAVREKALDELFQLGLPFVLYESPKRIRNLMSLLEDREARVVTGREITKQFEEISLFRGEELKEKGEFAVVVEPQKKDNSEDEIPADVLKIIKDYNISTKDAILLIKNIFPECKPNAIKKQLLSS